MNRCVLLGIASLAAVVLPGCGSSNQANEATGSPAATATTTQTSTETTSTPQEASSYPVVRFSISQNGGTWPFTAQLISMKENPNGFPGGGVEPPSGHTVLMVQVNITSQTTGRPVPVPRPTVSCQAPGIGQAGLYGYDEGDNSPDVTGANIGFGDGQPHPWDAEWEVPESLDISSVKCKLATEPGPEQETVALS